MAHNKKNIWLTVAVASLGYFVDIYDLQLFNMVSKKSIIGIGITDTKLIEALDYQLFLWQMAGMLVGGLLWGIMGDRIGRKSVLFGSILLYSLANLVNAFVTTPEQYALVRFLAGFGLAGELGAAITLVSELLSKETRGYGTMIIVGAGALGAAVGAQVAKLLDWQWSYIVGGGLGLLLLLLRFSTFESGMFEQIKKDKSISKGNFFMLFYSKNSSLKYIYCILVGLPIWFTIGILIKFSEKFASLTFVTGKVVVLDAVMYCYIGLSLGDLLAGWLSQVFRNRKKIIIAYLITTTIMTLIFLFVPNLSPALFNFLCFMVGCCAGYWGLFATVAGEQFGTNIRATVATTVPNFVRGAVIPITLSFKAMEATQGAIYSALWVGMVCIGLAIWATWHLEETFGKDLNYIEPSTS